jgi:hemolysin activation/secretion protein
VVAAEPVKPAPALPVEAQPRAAAPVVAAVEPSKPAPAAGAAEAKLSTPAPVAAAVEPAKPAPVTPAPAVTTAETKPTVAAAGPAKPVLATPAATAAVEAKRVVVAPPVPVVVAAEPVKSAPTSVVTAEPVKSARASSDPSLEKTRAPAAVPAVAVVQPMKPDYVLAEAKNPTDGRSSFVGTAGTLPAAQPASTTPAIAVTVGAAQPVADRAEPAKPAPAAAASATTPTAVLAQAEPVKPAAPKPAPAAEPEASGAPKFTISRYAVEGSTLLKQQDIDRALAPFTGPGKDFGDVQRALEALQLTYQKEGYGGVEIRLPEQELEKGEVKLRVIEPKIAKITVEGNEYFTEANVRRSVPALKEGETPNSREIGKSVRLANENPSKQSAVLLRASEREDQLDATIRVSDVDPKRYSVSLDNTGNSETHYERLGLAFQHSNMFGLDQVLTAQFITAPLNYHDVTVFGVGYRIPLYSFGDSLDLVAGYSNVDSGTVQNLFVVSGQGAVYAVRYNQNLPRWGDLEHRFSYGFDYRAYQNDVKPTNGDTKLVPDITVHPVTLTYSGSWRAENKGELSYYASMLQNIPGGNDGRDDNFKAVGARFPDGTASYRLFRTGVTYARPIVADWQVRIRADGQYTEDALVSPEMFAIGGADSVRGFNERYVANDKGYRTSWELYTPDTAKAVGLDGRLRFLAFYDQGVVKRNKIQPGELSQQSLDSAGVGLRLNYKTNLTVRLDVAYVYHDGTSTNGKDGQTRGHIAMAWVW